MLGTKLCACLCALLVLHSGWAEHDVVHVTLNQSDVSTETSPVASVSGSNLDSISPMFNSSERESLTTNATADEETTTRISKQVEDNGNSVKLTNESSSELPVVTTDSHPSPSRPPAIISTTDVAHTSSADPPHTHSPTPLPEYSTSQNDTPSLPDSTITLGNQSDNESPTASPTSATAPETSIAPSGNQSISTSGFIPAQEPSSSHTASSPPDIHPGTTEAAQPRFTTTMSNSLSSQAKTHVDNPSQLNVGEDPTVRHDSPMLDPLLAGLVSAFIITAVIITLLLFLKLRQRDNRPEFRRLQDLPMDDMMEDTPLSMYSY